MIMQHYNKDGISSDTLEVHIIRNISSLKDRAELNLEN